MTATVVHFTGPAGGPSSAEQVAALVTVGASPFSAVAA